MWKAHVFYKKNQILSKVTTELFTFSLKFYDGSFFSGHETDFHQYVMYPYPDSEQHINNNSSVGGFGIGTNRARRQNVIILRSSVVLILFIRPCINFANKCITCGNPHFQ